MDARDISLDDLNRPWPCGRVGYVALLGRPNSGKSTLMNTLLDTHLAAVSAKPQTTRNRWLGIFCEQNCQILFLDTPGMHVPEKALGEAMRAAIERAVSDADVLTVLADTLRRPGAEESMVAEIAGNARQPVVLALNKCDAASEEQIREVESFYRKQLSGDVPVLRVAGKDRATLDPLLAELRARLPEGPFLYDPEDLTDATVRQLGAELIREAVLDILEQEVPHATAVTIESWTDSAKKTEVQATLHVERPSQKKIVIGEGGQTVGRIRREAESRLRAAFGPLRLSLWVKVSRDWRKNGARVREFLS